jgi:hypothetical protein
LYSVSMHEKNARPTIVPGKGAIALATWLHSGVRPASPVASSAHGLADGK